MVADSVIEFYGVDMEKLVFTSIRSMWHLLYNDAGGFVTVRKLACASTEACLLQ